VTLRFSKQLSAAGTYAFGPQGFALGSMVATIYSEAIRFQNQNVVDDLQRLITEAEARSNAADIGVSLHALSAETSFPFTGTAVDNLALTSNGGVATLHVSAIAGAAPNVVYKVQHAAVSTYADLVTFAAVTASNSFQRIEVAAGTTVNRNLRMTITNGGTTSASVISGISGDVFPFITVFRMDPNTPTRLWIGGRFMWRTDNNATNWTRTANAQLTGGSITAISTGSNRNWRF